MYSTNKIYFSVVVPIYNEEECIVYLYESLKKECEKLDSRYEIIFVDDGSTDRTYQILSNLHEKDPNVKVVKFRKNYGQTAAMAAGFDQAKGDVIISMDGDLQNDPKDIPLFLKKINEGYDVVCGWRKDRQDKFVSRRLPSIVANRLISWLTGVKIHDNGCSLKAYRASVIRNVHLYSEMHRFIPAMATLTGAQIAEIVVRHHARKYGKSKYGISRMWRVFLDMFIIKMITGFSSRTALWFSVLSLPFWLIGIFYLSWGIYLHAIMFETISILILFTAIFLISIGIFSEMILKTGTYREKDYIKNNMIEII